LALFGLIACAPVDRSRRLTEPTGFGDVKFGATAADLLMRFPAAKLRSMSTPAQKRLGLDLAVYRIEGQRIGPLNDCLVDFRFFGNPAALVDVRFACPARDKALRYLTDGFGSPTDSKANMLTWAFGHTVVNYSPTTGAFDYSDRERASAMQLALIKAATRNIGNGLPQ
jgi:hypothetical protein